MFSLLYQGAVGLAVTLAVADTGGGWERDHPPAGRRLAAAVLPGVVGLALAYPFVESIRLGLGFGLTRWMLLAVLALLPFAALTLGWALTWSAGRPALVRRRWGTGALQSGVLGLAVAATFLIFYFEQPLWRSGVVLAHMAGTAGLLGSLGALTLAAAPFARERSEIAAGVPGAILKGALLLSGLALSDVGWGWLTAGAPATPGLLLAVWMLCGVAGPAVAAARLLPAWPARPRAWPVLLLVAFAGQWSASHLLFMHGELAPPLP